MRKKQQLHSGLASIIAAAAVHGMIHTLSLFLSPLNEEIRIFFGAESISAITAFKTTYLIVYALSNLVFGFLTNRISARRTLAIGMIANGIVVTAFSLVPSTAYWPMHLLWLIAAIGGGVYHPVANVFVTRLYPQRKGWTIGLTSMGSAFGFAFGPLVSEFLSHTFALTWQQVALIFGGVGIIVGVFAYLVVRDIPRRTETEIHSEKPGFDSKHTAVPMKIFWFFLAVLILISGLREISNYALQDISDFFLLRLYGQTGRTGLYLFLLYLPGIFISPIAGTLSDKLGRSRLAVIGLLLYGVSMMSMGIAGQVLIPILYFILGIAQATTLPTVEAIVADHAHEEVRGIAFGVFFTAGMGIGSIGPIASGAFVDALGGTLLAFRICLAGLGGFVLIGGFFLPFALRIPSRRFQGSR